MHSRSSLENHDVRPKWAKSIPKFRSKRCKNHTLWGRTYLYGLYKGLSPLLPSPPPPNPRSLQDHSCGLIVIVCLKSRFQCLCEVMLYYLCLFCGTISTKISIYCLSSVGLHIRILQIGEQIPATIGLLQWVIKLQFRMTVRCLRIMIFFCGHLK